MSIASAHITASLVKASRDERVDYNDRLNRVTAYIYDHLDDDIDLNRLAEVACLSPYHWHRVYHAMHGETIATTVRRLWLHRAAGYLAYSAMPMDEIAAKSGYSSVAAFTRAFHTDYGLPPAQYRKEGAHAVFRASQSDADVSSYEITIRQVAPMTAVAIDHTGSYMQVGRAFDPLFGWCAMKGLLSAEARAFGIFYDDPMAVPEAELRSRACVVVKTAVTVEAPVLQAEIPGGRCAVLRHRGPYATMRAAYQWLYGTWLTQSGEEPADAPVFEEYLNNPRDTAPSDLLTDIYLPLVARS
ncbi:AraC family transcriptional regulator [Bradyrhizobium prioriisuperbiae]|uniref:AraC family transcriptional regulator n=1 Tax=Bradyrhizobium prioriisuperbiae TaxID=2854389 RepID=UPI0028EA889C|nr:AraC family transcriptional regulator [Bradyrhizobium prioritasuperba]